MTALVLIATASAAMSASASDAKSAISEYFVTGDWHPKLDRSAHGLSLEICFDTCDFYQATKVQKESDLWDLAFLHQYYVINAYHLDDFRRKYASIAVPILKAHASDCTANAEPQFVQCVVSKLGARLGVTYSAVRYDEGYRCQVSGRLTDPNFQGKSVCKSVQRK